MTIQFPAFAPNPEAFCDKSGNKWVPDSNGRIYANIALAYFLENLFPYGFTLYQNENSDPVGAAIAAKGIVQAQGGPVVLKAADVGGVFSNKGCSRDVDYFLPLCSAGIIGNTYYFIVDPTAGNSLRVVPQKVDSFFGVYQAKANGNRLSGDKVFGNILLCNCQLNGGTPAWQTKGYGNWNDAGVYTVGAGELNPYS